MKVRNICASLASTVMISACIPNNVIPDMLSKPTDLTAEEQVLYANATPSQLLGNAEKQLQQAHESEFDLYAPETLARMEDQLKDLQNKAKKTDTDKRWLISTSKSIEHSLQSGLSNKTLVLIQLSDVFAQKKVLEEIGVPKAYPGDYNDAMDDVLDLVKYIESGKPDKARSKTPSVMEDMRKLEIRLIKENTLTKAKAILEKAEDKEAGDIAEKSYTEAIQAYERAVKYIDGNPRDTKEVTRLGNEALFYANRAVRITEEVARLQEIKPKEFESIVLDAEHRLQRISEAMRSPDVRDQSLHDQSIALANTAEKLIKANESSQGDAGQLAQSKSYLVAAEEKIRVLESENASLQLKLQELNATATPAIEEQATNQPSAENSDVSTAELGAN